MSVNNGQRADQDTFNNGFLSQDTDSDTTAVIGLNNPSSGGLISNAQQKINDNTSAAANAQSDIDALNNSKDQPSGIPTLDGSGLLKANQLPAVVLKLQGSYNAATNTPTLADTDTGVDGFYYIVTVAGSQDFGNGSLTFQIGDWVFYNNTTTNWEKMDNIDQVVSVAGKTGSVTLDALDISETALRYWSNKNNLVAVTAPSVNDDTTLNYVAGSFWFNQSTNELYNCVDNSTGAAVWNLISGGGGSSVGSSSIWSSFNCDNDVIGNWTNTGTGTFTFDSASPLNGTTSYKFVASAQNDEVKRLFTPVFRNKGKENSLSVQYTMDVLGFECHIYDTATATIIESFPLEISTGSKTLNIPFILKDTATTIEVRFKNTHATNTPTLFFDDGELSDNPFAYKNLIDKQSIVYDTFAGYGSTNTAIPYMTTEVSNTGRNILTVSNSSTLGFSVTANRNCTVVFSFTGTFNAIADFGISLNSAQLTTDIASITSTDRLAIGTTSAANYADSVSISIDLNTGDVLRPHASTAAGTAAKWSLVVTAQAESEHVLTPQTGADSMVRLHTGNGHGSTNTAIRRFTTAVDNFGTDITYTDSATLGASFTVNKSGFYYISYVDGDTAGTEGIGVSLNSSELTTGISSLTVVTDRLGYDTTGAANYASNFSWQGFLNANDVIRPHTDGSANFTTTATFTISKLGFKSLSAIPVKRVAYVKDLKSSGTAGGSSSATTIHTRDLNTLEGDISFISLSANQFTIQAGDYDIESISPASNCDRNQAFLYNVTDAVYVLDGSSEFASSTPVDGTSVSTIKGRISITSPKTYEVRHWTQSAFASQGLGVEANGTSNPQSGEVYTTVKIEKIK
ncbi:MAG: hypothetical protein OEL89_00320 [Candidatus Peregrinibacteria bacterium]|nr:hypothetical protein [Candidatus Peregrinibacteria bacterium]